MDELSNNFFFQHSRTKPLAGFALQRAMEFEKKSSLVARMMKKFAVYIFFILIIFAINYSTNSDQNRFLLARSVEETFVKTPFGYGKTFETVSRLVFDK